MSGAATTGAPLPARALRAAIVCPGRGSYARAELGQLGRVEPGEPREVAAARAAAIAAIDEERRRRGEGLGLADLDGAERFSAALHLRSDNASDLVLACAVKDLGWVEAAVGRGRLEVACVLGNSLGFYLALHAAGALDLAGVARLVGTMGALQVERGPVGGQAVYPVATADSWAPDPTRRAAVEAALAASGARLSIDLGGAVVLAGSESEIRALEAALPREERGGAVYPLRLAAHSAFHTEHMRWMSEAAAARLAGLRLAAPRAPLIDGRGGVHRPLSADLDALWAYTVGAQVTSTYDFARSLRVALREYAPDLVLALGPGESLGAPIGQTLVAERYRGIADKAAFQAQQQGALGRDGPVLVALGRDSDRTRFAGWLAGEEGA